MAGVLCRRMDGHDRGKSYTCIRKITVNYIICAKYVNRNTQKIYEVLINAWVNLKDKPDTQRNPYNICLIKLVWNIQNRQSTETKQSSLTAQAGGAEKWGWLLNECKVFFWGDENILELEGGQGDCTLWLTYLPFNFIFKMVVIRNFMVYALITRFKN
jgi:hypothetical protein